MKNAVLRTAALAGAVAMTAALAAPASGAAPHGAPWARHTIDSAISGADGVRLGDVNADGLPDIATGWEEDGMIRAYVHPGLADVTAPWPVLQVGPAPSAEDAVLADLDADGRVDVVGSTEGDERSVYAYWSEPDGSYTRQRLPAPAWQWMYAVPADLDGEHGIDLVVGGKNAGAEIGVLVSPEDPRDVDAWRYVPLGPVGWTMTLALRDLDEDGDDDVLVADRRVTQPPDRGDLRGLRWLENPGSVDAPWVNHFLGRRHVEVMFSGAGDLDGDGDTDYVVPNIVTGEGDARDSGELHWLENRWNGRGAPDQADFAEHALPWPERVGRAKAAEPGDLDLDGRQDVALTFEEADDGREGLVWLRQKGSSRHRSWSVRRMSGVDGIKHDDATLVDIDRDGDLDVFTTEERLPRAGLPTGLGVIWYENPVRRRAGRGTFPAAP